MRILASNLSLSPPRRPRSCGEQRTLGREKMYGQDVAATTTTTTAAAATTATTTAATTPATATATATATASTTLAVILDIHYLQVATKSFSLGAGGWSLPAFESALAGACGGGSIVLRYACDAAAAGSSPGDRAKGGLHAMLERGGYTLVISPAKACTGTQGATDVDIACCIFEAAGAFATAPAATQVLFFAHPPISPICRTPLFPYLTFYSCFLARARRGRLRLSAGDRGRA